MSKRSNVNPDHYKAAGRERPDDIARERQKQARAKRGDEISARHGGRGATPTTRSPRSRSR
jgi:hypothetical protein